MDISPCRVAKMKLHSRVETCYKFPQTDPLMKFNFLDTQTMAPVSARRIYLRTIDKPKVIEAYKPSSSLYKKLSAKIYVNNIEFLKNFSGSPGRLSRHRHILLRKIMRPQELNPAYMRTPERALKNS